MLYHIMCDIYKYSIFRSIPVLFLEKGFCILGESCPYDHGVDPLVIGGNEINPFPPPPPLGLPPPGMPIPPNARKTGGFCFVLNVILFHRTLYIMIHVCTCMCSRHLHILCRGGWTRSRADTFSIVLTQPNSTPEVDGWGLYV